MSRETFIGLLAIWLIVLILVGYGYYSGSLPQDLLLPMLALLMVALIGIFVLAIKRN